MARHKPFPEALKKLEDINKKQEGEYRKNKEALLKEDEAREKRVEERSKKYAAEYVESTQKEIGKEVDAESKGGFYVPGEAKFAIVVRIRGLNKLHPAVRKTLQLLRLRQKNNAVFVRLNKATIQMLKNVEPCIAYGYPTVELVRKLIYTMGACTLNNQRIKLTDNKLVSVALGQFGVESLEDLAHEIYTVGPNFSACSRFLAPFKLASPRGGMRKITRHFVEGGDYGNREHLINDLVERMMH